MLEVLRDLHDDQRYLGVPAHEAVTPYDIVLLSVDNCSTMLGIDNGLFALLEEVTAPPACLCAYMSTLIWRP